MGEEVLQESVSEELQELSQEVESVTVNNSEEFLSALSQKESYIIINGIITIGDKADSSGKMYPVEIPGGTTIQGTVDSSLNCRCPIQLTGNNVTFKDLEITFSSSDALGSVPHREIFLAGHSLTIDNVETYLAGGDGALGGFGGSEEELLPTIYAGGFENTSIGSNADLTVINGNSNTMFKGIYMSHDSEKDNKVPYKGTASVKISPKITVREGIYTEQNSDAEILISDQGYIYDLKVYGNEKTTIHVNQTNLSRTELSTVENLLLEDAAYLELQQGDLKNVTLQKNACLDLSQVTDCIINGNFVGGTYDLEGESDTTGILVVNKEGSVDIKGVVENTTIFQTENRNFPGEYISDKKYITASSLKAGATGFILPDSKVTSYEFLYENDGWTVYEIYEDDVWPLAESIDIISAPAVVDISKIKGTDLTPAEQAPFCVVFWKDKEGNAFSASAVQEYGLYYDDIIIGVKTSYWTSEESAEEEDWGNVIQFVTSEEMPNQYYFYAEETSQIKTGEYTFLFCSEYCQDMPLTVADVKALKEKIKTEMTVYFYDSTEEHDPEAIDIEYEDIQMETIPPQTYTGKMLTPDVKLTKDQVELVKGQDYLVTYENSVQVGEKSAKAIVVGIGNYYGTREMFFSIIEDTSEPSVTPIPSITVTPSATPEPSITVTPSATPEPSITVTPSVIVTPSVTPIPSITVTPSAMPEPSITVTPKPSVTWKPSATLEPSATWKPSATPKPSITVTPSATPEPSVTWKPSAIPEPSITVTPSTTPEPNITVTPSIPPTASPSVTVPPSIIVSPSATTVPDITVVPNVTVTPYMTISPSATVTFQPTVSLVATESPTATTSPTGTENPTATESPTATTSPAVTATTVPNVAITPVASQKPEHNHVWDSGKVTKKSTMFLSGRKTYTCTICGSKKTEVLPLRKAPKKGTILTDNKSKAKYKVTKSGKKDGTVECIRPIKSNTKTVTIPEKVSIDGIEYKVTSIASKAFYNCKKLKTVTIGKNIKKIGEKAFYGCQSLKTMNIKTTKLTEKNIGKKAFSKVNKKVTVKVPSKKLKLYQKIFKSKGLSKKAKYKK